VRFNFVSEKNGLNVSSGVYDVKTTSKASNGSLLLYAVATGLHLIRRAIEILRSGYLGPLQKPTTSNFICFSFLIRQ